MTILNKLNEKQRVAAEQIDGPLLILAGAGSGKTRTLTYRIAYMVLEKNINPHNILAVTFTNKAAKEMNERVNELIGEESKKISISTFHSFGVKLLRIHAKTLGYGNNFNIYDSDDQKKIIAQIMKELVITNKNLTTSNILSRISKYKENSETSAGVEENAHYEDEKIVATIYKKYENELMKNSAMDFSDLLINTNKLLNNREILEKIQSRYQYIMVDEYQDTNNIQYQIITKIADKNKNICVVGDEDQSIYAFRGANINNILNFEKDYKNALVVKLEQNYRSTKNILEAANSIIKLNATSKGKKLWTEKQAGKLIEIYDAIDGKTEADYIISEIIKGKQNGKSYGDYTILYRTNAQSRIFEEVFLRYNINYKIFGGMQFYQRVEVKDVISYLRVINNSKDTVSLFRIINIPKRKIGEKTIRKISTFAETNSITFFEAMGKIEETSLGKNLKITILNFYKMLREIIEASKYTTASEVYDMILEKSNYMKYLSTYDDKYEIRMDNVRELKSSMKEMEDENGVQGHISLTEFLEKTSLIASIDKLDDTSDYVKLMTIHNSKGLEFPVVFLVGMEDELFPGSKVDFVADDLEEERRLCYVAITRAMEKLHISHASERMIYGKISYTREPSRFISEIDSKFLNHVKRAENIKVKKSKISDKVDSNKKNSLQTENTSPFKTGEKVIHVKFGMGIVKGVELGKRLVVRFIDGDKKLPLTMAEKFLKKE